MNICLMIDTSSSMNELYDYNTKFDVLKEKIGYFMRNLEGIEQISLYGFNTDITDYGILKNRDDVSIILDSIKVSHLSTKIWDCLDKVIDLINHKNDTVLFCVTDGEDMDSTISYNDIIKKLKRKSRIHFHLLDITGKIDEIVKNKSNMIKNVEEIINIGPIMNEILKKEKEENSIKISVPIIPIIDCEESYIKHIQVQMQIIIPYLEKLTALRYYPVPTYIVDKYTMKKVEKELDDNNKGILLSDVEEILRFVRAVCLTYHTCNFEGVDSSIKEKDYKEFLPDFGDDARRNLREQSEVVFGVAEIIRLNTKAEDICKEAYFIPPISREPNFINNVNNNLVAILGALKSINKTINNVMLGEEYFCYYSYEGDYPSLDIWEKYLSKESFVKVRGAVDFQGNWMKNISHVIIVFEIAIDILIKLLRKWHTENLKFSSISKNIHTFGVYLPPSHEENRQLSEIIGNDELAKKLNLNNTGKVLLCLELCREHVQKIKTNGSKLDEELLKKLLALILVHEHTHAIANEGISILSGQEFSSTDRLARRYKSVSESLAEWSELNYSRGDRESFEIVMEHISIGDFPSWPYAGALLIEKDYSKNKYMKFRTVLDIFRADIEDAYKLLTI